MQVSLEDYVTFFSPMQPAPVGGDKQNSSLRQIIGFGCARSIHCWILTSMLPVFSSEKGGPSQVCALERIHGSAEMADFIQSKDWSKTSLGAIETWSEALISVVNIMLHTPLSFALYWGKDMTLLYNDVYRAFLGISILPLWASTVQMSGARHGTPSVLPSMRHFREVSL